MTIVIRIYILLCLSLLLFDVVFLFLRSRKNLSIYRTNRSFAKAVREEIDVHRENGAFRTAFTDSLGEKLAKTKNLLTLQNAVGDDAEAWEWFRPFVFAQMERYTAKDNSEQAYYTYLLSTFNYGQEQPSEEFINRLTGFLDTRSLYTFSNTMICLYAVGRAAPLMLAMDKINERKDFYHKKLLVDGLLTVENEVDELNGCLAEKFHSYNPYLQDCLMDYFRLRGVDVSDLCLEILRNEKADPEVSYSAMRYFSKYPNEDAKAYFLAVLADEKSGWVRQLLAVQGLGAYDDPGVFDAVSRKVYSPNWHIRTNAVAYMHRRGLSKEQIFDILYQRDRYANESLLYQYRDDKEMTRYIIDTIHLLNMQDEAAAGGGSEDISGMMTV